MMEIPIGALVIRADFGVAYAVGLGVLMLFCFDRFNQPTAAEGSFVETLAPRTVANDLEYSKALAIYVLTLAVMYSGLSLIGPYVFVAFGLDGATAGFSAGENMAEDAKGALEPASLIVPAWVPLAILLILIGGATRYKILNQIEYFARRLTHRLMGIPRDIERLAQALDDRPIEMGALSEVERDFMLSAYNQTAMSAATSLADVDRAVQMNDALRRWLRLRFLYFVMENGDLPARFEATAQRTYESVWRDVGDIIEKLRSAPEHLRLIAVTADKVEHTDRNRRRNVMHAIDKALHDLHALIAIGLCPVRNNATESDKILGNLRLGEGDVDDLSLLNRVLLALIILFFCVLFAVYTMQGDPLTAFRWATASFFLHGGAALSAWRHYNRQRGRGVWSPMHLTAHQIPTLQYIHVGLRGYLYGVIMLAVWHILDFTLTNRAFPTLGANLVWIPGFGSLGILTAFWVAYGFDVAQRPGVTRLRRILQLALQTSTTGAVAFFIAITVLQVLKVAEDAAQVLALRIFIATAVAAGALGFFAVFLTRRKPEGARTPNAAPDGTQTHDDG